MFIVNQDDQPATRTVKSDDPNYFISDGITVSPRAGIEVSHVCPDQIKRTIIHAYNEGWIKPFAVVTSEEYTWMSLRRK